MSGRGEKNLAARMVSYGEITATYYRICNILGWYQVPVTLTFITMVVLYKTLTNKWFISARLRSWYVFTGRTGTFNTEGEL